MFVGLRIILHAVGLAEGWSLARLLMVRLTTYMIESKFVL